MKEKFKKLILLSHENDKHRLIADLQNLGVLHIEKEITKETEEMEAVIQQQNTVKNVINRLTDYEQQVTTSARDLSTADVVDRVIEIEKSIDHLRQQIEANKKELERLNPWGDFSYSKFKPLIERGYHIFLANIPKRTFSQLDLTGFTHEVINETSQHIYLMLITRKSNPEIQIDYFHLPESSPSDIQKMINNQKDQLLLLKEKLANYASYLPDLRSEYNKENDRLELLKAENSLKSHVKGKLYSLSGWFPIEKENLVREFLDNQQAGYIIREPYKNEDVPVLLKNRKYTKLYEPITGIFELPNYYETDLTPFIAVFYPILFAYCLGDAGYGFVLAMLMAAGYFTFLKGKRRVAILGFILGAVTMLMGLVKSGSLFGIMLLPDHKSPWIQFLSQFVLIPDDSDFIFNAFNVALMIGVVQILTGIIISIYTRARYEGSIYALNPTGKLLIVLSLIWVFMADMQNISWLMDYEFLRYGMLITGMLLVIFFHQLDLSVGKRVANAVMPLFFIFTGLLGDVLSYVRLFALGLASSVLGLVVNQIGDQIMEGGLVSLVIGILFLIFGHTLNFGIAALGSFVHPLRLTFVEFYGNAAFKGKGLIYKPFGKSLTSLNKT
ncbi:MAG: V-type ATPase 116kDa subunit family protein [Fulvivirga sp.]|nr:V-type ATPase 116kDa subunit family protein [Fulvivirga sp.]